MPDSLEKLFSGATFAIFIIAFTIGYAYLLFRIIKVLRRHPATLTIAILGFPNSGKTVYITTLFDELQQGKSKRLRLTPYGTDTVEEVTRNLNSLARGQWLPRTKSDNVFFFRAIISVRDTAARIKLEIGDFAGEDISELQPSSDRWLHRSDYFKYVMDSDAIMLALDGEMLGPEQIDSVDETVNAFIAAIQIVADNRGAVGNRRLRVPVALLVMKADLFDDEYRNLITAKLNRLISVCKERCLFFEFFFVSSTGPVRGNEPPVNRQPMSVIEPLEWAIIRLTRSSVFVFLSSIFSTSTSRSEQERRDRERWGSSKGHRR